MSFEEIKSLEERLRKLEEESRAIRSGLVRLKLQDEFSADFAASLCDLCG